MNSPELGMIRGDSHTFEFKSDTPLSAVTARLTFSRSPKPKSASHILLQKTGVISADKKTITFEIAPSDTEGFEPGTLYYDMQMTAAGGVVSSTAPDTIELIADITVGV